MKAFVQDPKEPNVNLRVPNPSRTRCVLAGLSAHSGAGVKNFALKLHFRYGATMEKGALFKAIPELKVAFTE